MKDIASYISKEIEKAIYEQLLTSTISTPTTTTSNPLTKESLLETVRQIKESLPSFEALDQMIEKGYSINDIVLMGYGAASTEYIHTKHGVLKVISSPMLNPGCVYLVPTYYYLQDGIQIRW